jgi:competence protein ComEC
MSSPNLSRVHARPLIPFLLALAAGTVGGLLLPKVSTFPLAVLTLVALLPVLFRKGKRTYLLLLLLCFFFGYRGLQIRVRPELPSNHVARFTDDKPWQVSGSVDAQSEQFAHGSRFILAAESLARKGVCHKVAGTVHVSVRGRKVALRPGDGVSFDSRLKEIRNFNNPGGFDYRRHLAFQGVLARASVAGKNLAVRMHSQDRPFGRTIACSREAVWALIEEAAANRLRGESPVMKALLTGDRGALSQETRDIFSRIGTSHLLAISGLHIGIVATVAFRFFRLLLARSERVLLAAWAQKGAALLSLFPVLFYGLLAGMSPATQRAVAMVVVFMLGTLLDRQRDPINTLAAAGLVILIAAPPALFTLSFQLSFTAVFAILYTLERVSFAVQLRRGSITLVKRLALFFCVSAAAILGTLPITLYYFNQTSLIGILTNCIMVPLIGFVVVPLGLLSVLFLLVSSTVAFWLMKGAVLILGGALELAALFSSWPWAAARTVTPGFIEIALYYALAWLLLNYRRARRAKVLLLFLSIAFLVDGSYWGQRRFNRSELTMTVLDVGQGSSTLLELPRGPCILVDGGGFYDNRFDVGARVVAPFLWSKKIATVDILVLSHPHPDHLNGLLFIARHFHVKEVWVTGEPVNTEAYQEFLSILESENIRVVRPRDLVQPRAINGVSFDVLYPPGNFLERKAVEAWRTRNNNSLVLKVSFGDVSFLLPGDIEAEAEKELVGLTHDRLRSDVLLVPHHGSKSSSTPEFLSSVEPDVAVVSAGWKNIFRFPHDQVLEHYQAMGCETFRTDLHGAVTINTDGKGIEVKTFLPN